MQTDSFHLPTDTEELADLAAFGVTLTPDGSLDLPNAQCAIDASASQLMRAIGNIQKDLDRYADARAEEERLIQRRFEQVTSKLIERRARLESIVRQYAEMSDFGEKKSRDLTWGVFGVRTVPAHVSITDAKLLLSWCRLSAPDLIQIKETETVPQRKLDLYVKATGEVPHGAEFTDAHQEAFCRPVAPPTGHEVAA